MKTNSSNSSIPHEIGHDSSPFKSEISNLKSGILSPHDLITPSLHHPITPPPHFPIVVALALALCPLSCGKKSDPQLLARVGSVEIRVDQFQEQMARRGGAHPQMLNKQALLDEMIAEEALYQRALRAQLDQDPDIRRAWRNLLVAKLKRTELDERIATTEITRAELDAAYEKARDTYLRPAAVRIAVLYMRVGPEMKPEKLAELQTSMADARTKALSLTSTHAQGFGPLAINYSEDQASRYQGGVIGWVETNRAPAWFGPFAVQTAFALKSPGDISQVISDSQGIYLLKLIERRDPSLIPFAEVEPALRHRLIIEKRRRLDQDFVREAREALPVEIHPEALARVPSLPTTAVANNQPPPSLP
jgi:parvulin-like peptidyl-prolyl isomerase